MHIVGQCYCIIAVCSQLCVVCTVQSYLQMSHSSLKSDSLGLDLSGTARSAAGLSTGREEHVNYMLDLSDDDADVITVLLLILLIFHHVVRIDLQETWHHVDLLADAKFCLSKFWCFRSANG